MDQIFLWLWTAVLLATVVWWLIMLVCVAFIGPVELKAMFRKLTQPDDTDTPNDANVSE